MPGESSENMNNPELTDVEWLKDHIDDPDIRIVDTRPSDDYIKGHVKNSINIGLSDMVKTQRGLPAMCVSEKDINYYWKKKGSAMALRFLGMIISEVYSPPVCSGHLSILVTQIS